MTSMYYIDQTTTAMTQCNYNIILVQSNNQQAWIFNYIIHL